jgi:uncharacterized membrane protein
MFTLTMKKRIFVIVMSVIWLTIGASVGYSYRDRSAYFVLYDRSLSDMSMMVHMMDALKQKKYDVVERLVVGYMEGVASMMIPLYNKYEFHQGELIRCAVTRKARVLYEEKKILSSREELEELGYPYREVTEYLVSNCEGKPSHDDWTALGKSTEEKEAAPR